MSACCGAPGHAHFADCPAAYPSRPAPPRPVTADLRAGIEALCDDPFRGYGVDVVRVSDLRALLAAHPVQNEVTFETNLLDPAWLTTSSSRYRPEVTP